MSLAEVPHGDLSADEARALTERIRQTGAVLWAQVVKAFQGRAWIVLGYETWDAYCDAEFDGAQMRLPREQRREVVASLADHGMSTRAIAAATGISKSTIADDLSGVQDRAPAPRPTFGEADIDKVREITHVVDDEIVEAEIVERPTVIGLDGKRYPTPFRPTVDPEAEMARARAEAVHAKCVALHRFVGNFAGLDTAGFAAAYRGDRSSPPIEPADIDAALAALTVIAKEWSES